MKTSMTKSDACVTETKSRESSATAELSSQTLRPTADIYEAEDAWHLVLEIPGVDESGTEVSVEKNVLTVTGNVDAFDAEGFDRHYAEFAAHRYVRSFRLPEEVDASAVEASVKNGVLRLRLPKVAAALPYKVTVKAG